MTDFSPISETNAQWGDIPPAGDEISRIVMSGNGHVGGAGQDVMNALIHLMVNQPHPAPQAVSSSGSSSTVPVIAGAAIGLAGLAAGIASGTGGTVTAPVALAPAAPIAVPQGTHQGATNAAPAKDRVVAHTPPAGTNQPSPPNLPAREVTNATTPPLSPLQANSQAFARSEVKTRNPDGSILLTDGSKVDRDGVRHWPSGSTTFADGSGVTKNGVIVGAPLGN